VSRAFSGWLGWPVAMLLMMIGLSACTAADSRSAATPPVPRTSATRMGPGPLRSATVAPPAGGKKAAVVPRADHVVVVILENEHRSSVIGSLHAPYLNKLAARGANLTHFYGITYPSQPNYLALLSGSTHGMTSNACPQRFPKADNLGHQLRTSGLSFAGYAESLAKVGFTGCVSGQYRRKDNPRVNFTNLPASVNRPFRAFPRDYRRLPTVSFVSPNMCHSMHDCSIRTADRWMKKHLDRYAQWATHHNSWMIHLRRERRRHGQPNTDHHHRRPRPPGPPTPGRSTTTTCSAPSRRTGCPRSAVRPMRPLCRGSG
jgi:hypothetical protein